MHYTVYCNYMKRDYRSYRRNFCCCEKKAWKKKSALYVIRKWTSAIPVQRSTNWALHRYRWGLGFESRSSLRFFLGFLFVTAKVASTTVMIFYHIILHPAVHIYDFHVLITTVYCVESSIFSQWKDLHECTIAPWILRPRPPCPPPSALQSGKEVKRKLVPQWCWVGAGVKCRKIGFINFVVTGY